MICHPCRMIRPAYRRLRRCSTRMTRLQILPSPHPTNNRTVRSAAGAATVPPYDPVPAGYNDHESTDLSTDRSLPATASRFDQQHRAVQQMVPSIESASDSPMQAAGRPGPQLLEGPQTPTLTVHKVAPDEIQVGRAAKFEIRVRNVGRVSADNVLIRDEVPAGTTFIDSSPKATRTAEGAVVLGSRESRSGPGDHRRDATDACHRRPIRQCRHRLF